MLTQERYQYILQQLDMKGTITVSELVEKLSTSESTIRRDLTTLHGQGKLIKIHGGAMLSETSASHVEYKVNDRHSMNSEEKMLIAKKAASLIKDGDVIYIDAGTTTENLIKFITAKDLIAVTNGIVHAKKLMEKGIRTFILGGEINPVTEAIVGVNAKKDLEKYNFSKGFFGANGVSTTKGYSTPAVNEAMIKQEALQKCRYAYVLADHSKIGSVSFISFGELSDANIITDGKIHQKFKEETDVIEVDIND